MDAGIIVWFICLIPLIITGIFYYLKPHEFVWWELLVTVGITIGITFITKLITDDMNVMHKEVWGSTIIEVYESEPWNEWVVQTCTETYACGTDSKGNTTYCTRTYDCSYQDNHGPRWYMEDDIGQSEYITEHQYDSILNVWNKSRSIYDTHSNHCSSCRAVGSSGTKFEGTNVGRTSNVYKSVWNSKESTRIPYASTHKYENRIQASDYTVFDIKVINEAEADSIGLFEYIYPSDGVSFPTILSQVPLPDSIQNKFQKLNAKFGPSNRMRLWILVFKNAPSTFGALQENYWVRGNFNELVVCVSVDRVNIIQWAHVFSWTLTSELPVKTRQAFTNAGVLNREGWNQIYEWFDANLGTYIKRSHDEFSYIKVDPPTWAIILNIILSIGISIGLNFWVTNNESYDEKHEKNKNRGYYRRYY